MVVKSNYYNVIIFLMILGLILFSFNLTITKENIVYLYDSKRFFVVGIVWLTSLITLSSHTVRCEIVNGFSHLPLLNRILLLTVLFSMAMSTITSENAVNHVSDFFFILGMAITCYFIRTGIQSQRSKVIQVFALVSLLLFFSVAIAFWLRLYFNLETNYHTIFSFANPRFLNQVQVWLIIPVLYMAMLAKRKSQYPVLYTMILSASVATIIATDARGVSVALFATVMLWAFLDRTWRVDILKLLIISMLLGYFTKFVLLDPLPNWLFYSGELDLGEIRSGTSGRWQLWKESLTLVNFWGNGGGYFVCASEFYSIPNTGHPHNSLLNIWVDWGILATVCFAIFSFHVLYSVVTTKRRLVRVFGLSILAGLAYSLVSGVLKTPLSQLLFIVSIAFLWTTSAGKQDQPVSKANHLILVSLAAMIVLSMSARMYERIEYYQTTNVSNEEILAEKVRIEFWLGNNCSM